MAQLSANTGIIVKTGPGTGTAVTASVDDTAVNTLGARAFDAAGNEYIYLQGVASTILGSVVTFNRTTGATTLIAANAIGPVAVAMAAIVANKFGWYCIYGTCTASTNTVAANAACYIAATAGRIDDLVVVGDLVACMYTRSADTLNLATVELFYPFVTDTLS